jgi:hypothetical protein
VAELVRDPDELKASASRDLSLNVFAEDRNRLDPVFVLGVAPFVAAVSISLIASIENAINARLGQTSTPRRGSTLRGRDYERPVRPNSHTK